MNNNKTIDEKDTIEEILYCNKKMKSNLSQSNTQTRMVDILDAVEKYHQDYQENILPEAIKQGYNINFTDLFNQNILFFSNMVSDTVFDYFVESDIDINQTDKKQENVLFLFYKNFHRTKKLLDYGINPLVVNQHGDTVWDKIKKENLENFEMSSSVNESIMLIKDRIKMLEQYYHLNNSQTDDKKNKNHCKL